MTTLCLNSDTLITTSCDTGPHTVQALLSLPRYDMDPEERRWQLEWDRRNVED